MTGPLVAAARRDALEVHVMSAGRTLPRRRGEWRSRRPRGQLFAPTTWSLHSPVTFHPFVGRDTVSGLLAIVAETFEDFRYTDELLSDGTHALIFRASICGGRSRASTCFVSTGTA